MSRWFEERRIEWVRETIFVYGFINREHLMRKFEISEAQAAKDLTTTQTRWPWLMTYNKSSKRYEAVTIKRSG